MKRLLELSVWLVLIIAVMARLLALRHGFWFDEIWSASIAWVPETTGESIKLAHEYNAHYLSILWMRICGPEANEFLLRLPSLIFSLATLALAVVLGQRYMGTAGRFILVTLWSFSYLSIHYSVEARGYAAILFHAQAALLLDRMILAKPASTKHAILQSLNFSLGILAQPLFMMAALASGIWTLALLLRRRLKFKIALAIYGLPGCLTAAMLIWGSPPSPEGPEANLWAVFEQFNGLAFVGESIAPLVGLVIAIALLLSGPLRKGLSFQLLETSATRDLLWFLLPPILLWMDGSEVVYERYFLMILPLLLFRLAQELEWMGKLGKAGASTVLVIATAYLIVQLQAVVPYLEKGSGDYESAIDQMVDESAGSPIVVSSDHDFRNKMILDYHWQRRSIKSELHYLPGNAASATPPEWLILHDLSNDPEARPEEIQVFSQPYRLRGSYPKHSLSGWSWFLYHSPPTSK